MTPKLKETTAKRQHSFHFVGVSIVDYFDKWSDDGKTFKWVNDKNTLVFYFNDSIGFLSPDQVVAFMAAMATDKPSRFDSLSASVCLNRRYTVCKMEWD